MVLFPWQDNFLEAVHAADYDTMKCYDTGNMGL